MTFRQVIELLRDLCNRHPEIEGFYTGLEAQHDDSEIQYPAVRAVFPVDLITDLDSEITTLKMKVTIRVNRVSVTDGVNPIYEQNVNYRTENSVINEINTDLKREHDLRDNAFRIATHLVKWFKLSEEEFGFLKVVRAPIKGIERADKDGTTGANILFEFLVGNPYICEAESLFIQTKPVI